MSDIATCTAIERLTLSLGLPLPTGKGSSAQSGYHTFHAHLTAGDSALAPTMGVDADPDRAYVKALMEGLERHAWRHCARGVRQAKLKLTLASPGVKMLLERPFTSSAQRRRYPELGHPAQLKLLPTVAARSVLHKRCSVRLPACCLYNHAAPFFFSNTTSGWAAGFDEAGTEKRALLELVERDAFLRSWWTKRVPRILDTSALELPTLARVRTWISKRGLKLKTLLFPSDSGAYVIAAIAQGSRHHLPYFSMGLGCELSMEAAIDKALGELVGQLSRPVTQSLRETFPRAVDYENEIFSFHQRVLLYGLWPDRNLVKFVSTGAPLKAKHGSRIGLREMKDRLASAGHHAYLIKVDLPEFRRSAVKVYKVFSPTLIELDGIHRHRPLLHPRLRGRRLQQRPHPLS